jgi:archaellum biogenesis ATPase FlaH
MTAGNETGERSQDAERDAEPPIANFTEHALLRYALANREIANTVWPILKEEWFDRQYRPVFTVIAKHLDEFDTVPNPTMVHLETGMTFTPPADAHDEKVVAWVVREFERWAKHSATRSFIYAAIDGAKEIKKNPEDGRTVLDRWVTEIEAIAAIACHRDVGNELHRDGLRVICEEDTSQIIPTRYRHLDLVTGGGMCCPGMFIVAAKSGTGKSVFLTNAAVNFAEAGYDVVFITLEMSEKICFERFISIATDVPIRHIRERRDDIQNALDEHLEFGAGRVFVKYLPIGCTIGDIKGYVDNLIATEENVRPKLLVLDYMDLMRPRAKVAFDNIHLRDKFVSEELYDFAVERKVMCFTASQLVKGSEQTDEYTQDSLAGGTPKISIADYVGTLRRNYEKGLIELHLLKARHGGHDARIPLSWPEGGLRIEDGPDDEFYEKNIRFDPNWRERAKAKREKREANRDTRQPSPSPATSSVSQDVIDRIKANAPKQEFFQ